VKGQHADHRAEVPFSMDKSVVLSQRTSREYGLNERVARRTVYNIINKFQTHGTILNRWKVSSGRRRSGRNDGHIEQVGDLIREETPASLRKMARVLGDVSYVTVRAILRLDIKALLLGFVTSLDASRLATPHSNRWKATGLDR
jgi:hypothetical protein